jgi:hypothetical protein
MEREEPALPSKPMGMEYPKPEDTLPPVKEKPSYPEPKLPELPPIKPATPKPTMPEIPKPSEPKFPEPEPLQMPKPKPRAVEVKGFPGPPPIPSRMPRPKKEPVEMPEITPPRRPEISSVKPHLFVKIDKYNEVIDSVQKLKSELTEIRKTLRDLEALDTESMEKLKASETITNKITELITFFEQSFTAPE